MSTTTFETREARPDLKAVTTKANLRAEASETIKHVADSIESCRKELAYTYSLTRGGTDIEHEIGECLTLVRKAEKRLFEAYGELAQQELPLD